MCWKSLWKRTYDWGTWFTSMSIQGEWESNEASEDVFKDLLRVKKLSQRVSSVESKPTHHHWRHLMSFLKATVSLRWRRWRTTTRASSRRAATFRWASLASSGLIWAHAQVFAYNGWIYLLGFLMESHKLQNQTQTLWNNNNTTEYWSSSFLPQFVCYITIL